MPTRSSGECGIENGTWCLQGKDSAGSPGNEYYALCAIDGELPYFDSIPSNLNFFVALHRVAISGSKVTSYSILFIAIPSRKRVIVAPTSFIGWTDLKYTLLKPWSLFVPFEIFSLPIRLQSQHLLVALLGVICSLANFRFTMIHKWKVEMAKTMFECEFCSDNYVTSFRDWIQHLQGIWLLQVTSVRDLFAFLKSHWFSLLPS